MQYNTRSHTTDNKFTIWFARRSVSLLLCPYVTIMLLWNKLSRWNTNILTLISIFNLSYRYTRKPANISTSAIRKGSSRTGSNLLQHPSEISFHFRLHQRCTTTSSFQRRPMESIWGENSGICPTVHAGTPTWNFVSDNRHCIWPH